MSFRKTANAIVSRPNIEFDRWMEELRTQHQAASEEKQVTRIAKTVLRKCDPKQYLLSHATIVASVDCYEPEKAPVGRFFNRDIECVRKFPNFRIKPECQSIINNNGDAWERSLLLSTYRTFIGAPNYLEHIQIPELSKGFIVDAIARDLGETCYIDILVATDRKHKMLISDILSENIIAMSMGCHLAGTKVYLSDGSPINIEDVRPDMEVLSQKGNACRVENLQIRENRWNIQTIKSIGLPAITSTDNHNYYIVRKETIEYVRHRSPTGAKTTPQVMEKDYPFDYAEAGTVRVGDFLALPISQVEEKTSVSLSEARLLGLWVGDGWKFENKRDSTVGVGFCLDEAHPEIVQEAIRSLDQVAWKNRESHMVMGGNPVSTSSTSISNRRGAAYLTNTSRAFREIVDSHITGRNSSTKIINKSVMNWPRSHQAAFLSGLIDSDGCVSTNKRGTKNVFLSTRNEKLAHQYMQLAARCGVIPTLSRIARSGTKMLPKASGIDFQVKLRNADVIRIPSLKVQSSINSIRPSQAGRNNRWITDRYVYSKVKSITKSKHIGFVYDLEVDDDHSYIANGIGVSNCISLFTTCNKCGNVAVDDTQLCPCILYDGKGSKFHDEHGVEHKLAELIGNVAVPNSNQFIEASWVRNPAFVGAQRRNILNPEASTVIAALDKASSVYEIRKDEKDLEGLFRAASRIAQDDPPADDPPADDPPADDPPADDVDAEVDAIDSGFDSGEEDADADADADATSEPSPAPPIDKTQELMDKASQLLMENLVQNLAEKMAPKPEDVGTTIPGLSGANYNDNIIGSALLFDKAVADKFPNNKKFVRWASRAYRIVHGGGVSAIRAAGMTSKDLIVLSWVEDNIRARSYPIALYKLAMNVGPTSSFPSEKSFLAACNIKAGRILSKSEQNFLSWKGRIASLSVKF